MNMTKLNGVILVALVIGLSACSQNSAKKYETKVSGPRTEKAICKSSTTVSIKDAGGVRRSINESTSDVIRKVVTGKNGEESVEATGQATIISYDLGEDQSKTLSSKIEFTYVSQRVSKETILPDGAKRVESHISRTDTAKAGSSFRDDKGEEVQTRTTEHSSVNVTRTVGDKTVDLANSYDGKDQPVYDYVTITKNEKGVKIETTSLLAPITEFEDDNLEITTEKDEQVCTTEVIK